MTNPKGLTLKGSRNAGRRQSVGVTHMNESRYLTTEAKSSVGSTMQDAFLHAEFAFLLTLHVGALAWPVYAWLS